MKKRVLFIVLCGMFLATLSGCSKTETKKEDSSKIEETTKKEDDKKSTKVIEYISKLDNNSTLEDINKLIGFDGVVDSDNNKKYVWDITETSSLTATFSNKGYTSIEIDIEDELLKNDKVDFSKYEEISSALKNGDTVTYDDFKEKVGGVDGTPVTKSYISTSYKWVNKKGGYLKASFNNKTKKCTFVSGRI